MSKGSLNLQDSFLNQVRREGIVVRINLLDGRELSGRVKGFDNFTVMVVGEGTGYHLVYKHAIGQIVSPKPIHGTSSRKGGSGSADGGNDDGQDSIEDNSVEAFRTETHAASDAAVEGHQKGRKSGFNPLRLDQVIVRREDG
jgi:host factor-I protein